MRPFLLDWWFPYRWANSERPYYQAFGSDAPPCTYDDIDEADRHVVWGANPAVAHPVLFRWLQQAADEVEVVWTVATNPAAGMPEASAAREHLEEATVIAQDAFHTETTAIADVVLPPATWGESEGTAINMEGNFSRVRAVTEPPSGIWSDLDIIATIGRRLYPDLFESHRPDPARVFDEFATLTADTNADCSGVCYDRVDDELAVRWPAPDGLSEGGCRSTIPRRTD